MQVKVTYHQLAVARNIARTLKHDWATCHFIEDLLSKDNKRKGVVYDYMKLIDGIIKDVTPMNLPHHLPHIKINPSCVGGTKQLHYTLMDDDRRLYWHYEVVNSGGFCIKYDDSLIISGFACETITTYTDTMLSKDFYNDVNKYNALLEISVNIHNEFYKNKVEDRGLCKLIIANSQHIAQDVFDLACAYCSSKSLRIESLPRPKKVEIITDKTYNTYDYHNVILTYGEHQMDNLKSTSIFNALQECITIETATEMKGAQ